jgi:hypothetical protein
MCHDGIAISLIRPYLSSLELVADERRYFYMVGGVEFFLSFSFSFFAPKLGQGNSTKKMPRCRVCRLQKSKLRLELESIFSL